MGVRPLHVVMPSDRVCSGEDAADGLCGCRVCHHNRSLGTSNVGGVGVGEASCCPTLHSSTLCSGERELRGGVRARCTVHSLRLAEGEAQGRLGWASVRGA